MPKAWRIWQQEADEDRAEIESLKAQLVDVVNELELYRHPAWELFSARLKEFERADTETLIGSPVEETDKIRERIKMVRRVLQIREDLVREQQNLSERLGLDVEEEAEDG